MLRLTMLAWVRCSPKRKWVKWARARPSAQMTPTDPQVRDLRVTVALAASNPLWIELEKVRIVSLPVYA